METLKRIVVVGLLIGFVIFIASNVSYAQQACSNKSAKGTYGYTCNGFAANPFNNFAIEPFAGYGVVIGDGRGQWNGQGKVSFNGSIHTWTHNTKKEAPATVNPDCTGSVTYAVTVDGYPIPDVHFEFVFVDDGREVDGFPVDTGYAVTCRLILQSGKNTP